MTKDTSPAPPGRTLSWIAAITLGVPAATAVVLSIIRPEDSPWMLSAALTLVLLAGLVSSRTANSNRANMLLLVCALSVPLLWPEMVIRAMGISANQAGTVVFGLVEPSGTIPALRDPDLFWTLSPEQPGINTDGFPDSEFVIPKPDGNYRIVFLGDSCTQQGYPKQVEQILNQTYPDTRHYESVNLGISGYTSHQGLVVAKRWLATLEPDLVVVYFGWNDHWQAAVATDSERSRWYRRLLIKLISSSRLFQVAVWAVGPSTIERIGLPRVSLTEYRDNLADIGTFSQSVDADVLFLTAPSSHKYRGVPDYLVERGFAASGEAVTTLHADYNAEVINVANEYNWHLLDLYNEVQSQPALSRFFLKDGIHFTEGGLSWIAGQIAQQAVLAPDGQTDAIE